MIDTEGLDHVHLRVADREAAAAWLGRVLGLRVAERFRDWAEDPRGPLFLETHDGRSALALFQGPTGRDGDSTIAFRVKAAAFSKFVAALPELGLRDRDGRSVTADAVVDHGKAWSVYFCDPYGNRFELSTYDYAEVLASRDGAAT
ncbi:MAG: VOC family protein [Pseudomonadota bacterium]